MPKDDLKIKLQEILSRVDVQSEYESWGVITKGNPTGQGWLPCLSAYSEDTNPSAGINIASGSKRGWYLDFKQVGSGAKPWLTKSFWDFAVEHGGFIDFKQVLRHYAEKTGVRLSKGGRKQQPPKPQDVEAFLKNRTPDVATHLLNKRGLSQASIDKYKIGWRVKDQRNAIPVFDDEDNLVNIRFHNSKKKPKTLNWAGSGQMRLWGLDRLAKLPTGSTVAITEGEFDAMLTEQVTQEAGALLTTVSPTNGKNAFRPDWVEHFHGMKVVLLWDCDASGREAASRVILPVFRQAIKEGKVLSIKVVWLFDERYKADKTQKDMTDWIVKAGGSGSDLLAKINEVDYYEYLDPVKEEREPIQLSSFTDIDTHEAGMYVTCDAYVHGENSVAYHAVNRVTVSYCTRLHDKNNCTGREGSDGACMGPIDVPPGHRIMLACTAASDPQVLGSLREFVCDKNARPALVVEDKDRTTIREIFAHQVTSPGDKDPELVEKAIYIMGGQRIQIGQYKLTGWVHSRPRDQQPTILVHKLERVEADWQGFDAEKAMPALETLRGLGPGGIVRNLAVNVTRLVQRDELHLATMLTLCSPRWFNLPSDGRTRGWIASVVVGDTGTGKSTCTEKIMEYAQVGESVSGMTSSRTGLTYAIDYDERRGYRIKAGIYLKMSGQFLLLDETQDIEMEDLKTMADGIDRGVVKISRIQGRSFPAETRIQFCCNPKDLRKRADQTTMDSFYHGCKAVLGIFPKMMIRRCDLFVFPTSHDIEDKSVIHNPPNADANCKVSPEALRALIYWAWNLEEDQIIISDETYNHIRQRALELSNKFGACEDLPIVCPEDFRKTLARLSVATAILDCASPDWQSLEVQKSHVDWITGFLSNLYGGENCNLDGWSDQYKQMHGLGNYGQLKDDFLDRLGDGSVGRRLLVTADLLARGRPIKVNELSAHCDVSDRTIKVDMSWMRKNDFVTSDPQGYLASGKFIRFMRRIRRDAPEAFGNNGNRNRDSLGEYPLDL